MTRIRLVPWFVVLALAVTTCAEENPPPSTTGPTTGPVATAGTGSTGATAPTGATATGPTGSPSGDPPAGAELEDGRHFGYIQEVDVDALSIVFDLAYFLTGDEAAEAAEEHGDEAPPPNDYYIVNDNPRLRTLSLAPDLELVLLDWSRCCDETFEAGLEDFATAIAAGEAITIDDRSFYGVLSPYWVTIEGGAVTRIEEQYLP